MKMITAERKWDARNEGESSVKVTNGKKFIKETGKKNDTLNKKKKRS